MMKTILYMIGLRGNDNLKNSNSCRNREEKRDESKPSCSSIGTMLLIQMGQSGADSQSTTTTPTKIQSNTKISHKAVILLQ